MSELIASGGLGLVLAVVAAASGAGLVAGAGLVIVDRLGMRAKLRTIDELYNLVDVRDEELNLSFYDRLLGPAVRLLSRVGWRLSPAGRIDEIRTTLRRAGRADEDTDRYLAFRVLSVLVSPLLAWMAWNMSASLGGSIRLACTGLAIACCTILPSRNLRSQVEHREANIRRQLPDVLDLLIICMEAGLGFTSALSRTSANVEGELSNEFGLVLGEMRAGSPRSDALSSLAERVQLPEVRAFVLAMRQADQFGISVSTVLRDQAEDMRVARRQIAQEKAMKAPVKMLVPMVFCIFPPMFIVVIGPAALNMAASGGF